MLRTPPCTRSQRRKLKELTSYKPNEPVIFDINRTFNVSKDSFLEELLYIPGVEDNNQNADKHQSPAVSSLKHLADSEIFEQLKNYVDEKLKELTKVFTDQIAELKNEIVTLKNSKSNVIIPCNTESNLYVDDKCLPHKESVNLISDDSIMNEKTVQEMDINGKCNYLELENNLSMAVVENIRFKGYFSPFNLAAMVFRSINFYYDATTLENAYIFTMRNGQKKLIMKFYSKLVRSNFLELFGRFGYVTNFDLGFNDHTRIFVKEKLTRDNKNIYFHARRLLKDGIIKDFSTNSGFIYILLNNMDSFDYENYIKINNFGDFEKLGLLSNDI